MGGVRSSERSGSDGMKWADGGRAGFGKPAQLADIEHRAITMSAFCPDAIIGTQQPSWRAIVGNQYQKKSWARARI